MSPLGIDPVVSEQLIGTTMFLVKNQSRSASEKRQGSQQVRILKLLLSDEMIESIQLFCWEE